MGLLKNIQEENGITLNYHRVVSVNNITNISSIIEVASYTSEETREKEKAYQLLQLKEDRTPDEEEELERGIDVYIHTNYINIPYDKNLNVDNAYEYLKQLDEFKNSKND